MEPSQSKFYSGIPNPYNGEPSLAVINRIDQIMPEGRYRFYYELVAIIPDPTSLGWTTFIRELLSSPASDGFNAAEQLAEQAIKAEYKKAGRLPQHRDMLKAGDAFQLSGQITEAEFKKQFRALGRPTDVAGTKAVVSAEMLRLIDKIEKDEALKCASFRALIASLRPTA